MGGFAARGRTLSKSMLNDLPPSATLDTPASERPPPDLPKSALRECGNCGGEFPKHTRQNGFCRHGCATSANAPARIGKYEKQTGDRHCPRCGELPARAGWFTLQPTGRKQTEPLTVHIKDSYGVEFAPPGEEHYRRGDGCRCGAHHGWGKEPGSWRQAEINVVSRMELDADRGALADPEYYVEWAEPTTPGNYSLRDFVSFQHAELTG